MSRASSSFQKVEPSQVELLKTPGSRAYFRAKPRLDPPLLRLISIYSRYRPIICISINTYIQLSKCLGTTFSQTNKCLGSDNQLLDYYKNSIQVLKEAPVSLFRYIFTQRIDMEYQKQHLRGLQANHFLHCVSKKVL